MNKLVKMIPASHLPDELRGQFAPEALVRVTVEDAPLNPAKPPLPHADARAVVDAHLAALRAQDLDCPSAQPSRIRALRDEWDR